MGADKGAIDVAKRVGVAQMALRTLLIAPGSNLAYVGEEVQRVANALHPQLLFGNVTAVGVLDALGSPFDVVWIASHGTEEGIQLSDGLLVTPQLVQMLRQHPPRLVVLNSCNSLQVAMQLHDEIGAAVICTVVSIPDKEAFVTGSALAHALAAGNDIAQAYTVSKPGRNRQYVLLNGSVRLNGDDDNDDTKRLIMQMFAEQSRRIGKVESRLDTLEGNVERGFSEMRSCIQPQSAIRRWAWALGFALLFVPVPLFYSSVREIVGVEWHFALAVAFGCYAVSAVMFAYGNGVIREAHD